MALLKDMDVVIDHPDVEDMRHICIMAFREENWNMSVEDFPLWLKCYGKEHFFIARDKATGEPLGHIAGVRHSTDLGYIGMYYVKKSMRRTGIGSLIWKAAMDWLEGRNVYLHGAPLMWEKYRDREGFTTVFDWSMIRMGGIPPTNLPKPSLVASIQLQPPGKVSLKDLVAYDTSIVGFERAMYVELFSQDASSVCRVAVDSGSGKICGYAILRPTLKEFSVGPLYADTEEIALALMTELVCLEPRIEKLGVQLLVKSNDDRTKRLAQYFGLQEFRASRAMSTKWEIVFDERVFAPTDYRVNMV